MNVEGDPARVRIWMALVVSAIGHATLMIVATRPAVSPPAITLVEAPSSVRMQVRLGRQDPVESDLPAEQPPPTSMPTPTPMPTPMTRRARSSTSPPAWRPEGRTRQSISSKADRPASADHASTERPLERPLERRAVATILVPLDREPSDLDLTPSARGLPDVPLRGLAEANSRVPSGVSQRAVADEWRNEAPLYPRLALSRGHEGSCELNVHVDARGRVTDLSVSKTSGHPSLDRAALKAVARWNFRPAEDSRGRAVPDVVIVPVTFQIDR